MKGSNKIYLLVLLFFAACTPSALPVQEYIEYVQDETYGLKKKVELGDLEYTFQYKPVPYMVALEKNNDQAVTEKRLKDLNGGIWFNIQFKNVKGNSSPLRAGVSSLKEYQTRYNYYLNQASKDIKLLYKGDTLQPMSYVFETNYNLTPVETIVVGFDLPAEEAKPNEKMQIVFFDRIFSNGIIKATYSEQSLNKVPNCKF